MGNKKPTFQFVSFLFVGKTKCLKDELAVLAVVVKYSYFPYWTLPIFLPFLSTPLLIFYSSATESSNILPFWYINLSDIVPFRCFNHPIFYPSGTITFRYWNSFNIQTFRCFLLLPAGCPGIAAGVSSCLSQVWLTWACTLAPPPTPWARTQSLPGSE